MIIALLSVYGIPLLLCAQQQKDKEKAAPISGQAVAQYCHVVPLPQEMRIGTGKFRLVSTATICVSGNGHTRIYGGASRFLRNLSDRTGLNFMIEGYVTPQDTIRSSPIQIFCRRAGKVVLGEDESYTLTITPQQIVLSAETDIGALRGLATLLQLVDSDAEGYFVPALTIYDKPRFAWRGLLLDVARHFFSADVVKKQLDLLEFVKANVLHLHLTDDQGFRIESKTYPKLHELGSDGQYYSQATVREIIQYADERGIRIVPEFDLPGHSTSWYIGYPEFSSGTGATFGGPYRIDRRWGRGSPVMNPIKEEVYQFLDVFFKEMSELFPDEYMHIGGDENNGEQWATNPDIQAFMRQNNLPTKAALQNYFNKRLLAILTKHGKKMMGWDEIFVEGVPKTVMIQSWQGREALYRAARQGYATILSNGYYLDLHEPTDRHYLNDPVPDSVKLSAEEKAMIVGGEACMWSEYINAANVDSRIWPRMAAIAERLWSSASVRDVDDMYRRLEHCSAWLEQLGSTHETNVAMMLRRLTGVHHDIQPLKTFVDVLETVKEYKRGQLLKFTYTTFYPLTGIADVARPDARVARNFRAQTAKYLTLLKKLTDAQKAIKGTTLAAADSSTYETLVATREFMLTWLRLWKSNHERLLPIIRANPRLADIEEHSLSLSLVAQLGIEAIDRLERGVIITPQWRYVAGIILERAKQPRAQTDIMIIPAIEQLVKATDGYK
ncbi:MAG: family 20 glycosylhydrolase [Bacteroidota bacterium]|nr:family 20 glycosylhydrolase [Bacteroidota bacterium]